SVGSLLRTALQILETADRSRKPSSGRGRSSNDHSDEPIFIEVTDELQEPLTPASGSRYQAARNEWLEADREARCVRIEDETMSPVIAEGSEIVFADDEDDAENLDGHLVVAWIDEKPVVRRFQVCGRYGILRGEGAEGGSAQAVLDLE